MRRRITTQGYYEVYVPDHPMSKQRYGWVLEHRYIMSLHLGRVLTREEIVHHKDENKLNNIIENLELTNRSEHARGHEYVGVQSVCLHCGESFYTKQSEIDRGRAKYCSTECSGIATRKVERPSKEQLIEDISNLPYTKIGKKYGVSDNAVRKWAKKYELI